MRAQYRDMRGKAGSALVTVDCSLEAVTMVQSPMQIEGTWEQIVALAPSLSGYRLRLTVLVKPDDECTAPESAGSLSDQFAHIRAENPAAWNTLPVDLAEQHDHYIHGLPKK